MKDSSVNRDITKVEQLHVYAIAIKHLNIFITKINITCLVNRHVHGTLVIGSLDDKLKMVIFASNNFTSCLSYVPGFARWQKIRVPHSLGTVTISTSTLCS